MKALIEVKAALEITQRAAVEQTLGIHDLLTRLPRRQQLACNRLGNAFTRLCRIRDSIRGHIAICYRGIDVACRSGGRTARRLSQQRHRPAGEGDESEDVDQRELKRASLAHEYPPLPNHPDVTAASDVLSASLGPKS